MIIVGSVFEIATNGPLLETKTGALPKKSSLLEYRRLLAVTGRMCIQDRHEVSFTKSPEEGQH